MMTNKKVNLYYWLASQFCSEIQKPKRPLILGSLITVLAINLGIIDLNKYHNLHVACPMELLNMECLYRMSLVSYKDDHYVLTEPGLYQKPEHVHIDADTDNPSDSPPLGSSANDIFLAPTPRLKSIETSLQAIDHKVSRMENMLVVYFKLINFQPPPRGSFSFDILCFRSIKKKSLGHVLL